MDERTIQAKISESFSLYQNQCAIEYQTRHISYSELQSKSNQITHWLRNENIETGSFVGVSVHDRFILIAAMIGIWNAGCVFVPLDADYPNKRLESMIEAAELKVIIVEHIESRFAMIQERGVRLLEATNSNLEILANTEILHSLEYDEDDAVYIYFSSGTSGLPNAIVGRNKGLLHYTDWEINEFDLMGGKKVSQLTSPSHDPFLRDILVPLLSGGTICIPESKSVLLYAEKLMTWIEESEVQVIHCTPSLFKNMNMFKQDREYFKSLEYIFLAGEEISPKKLKNWYETMGTHVQLINLYGPTETTLAKLFYKIKPQDVHRARMPIGLPMSGARAVIVNEELQVCTDGTKGEIIIRTPYRSLGYFNNENLNRIRFIQNPFSELEGDWVYRTGDMGRLLPDGNIEFMGRKDRQVKIRGHRVELNEIEHTIMATGLVKDVAVIAKDMPSGDLMIVAYVIPNFRSPDETSYSFEKYKKSIENILLEPMIPSYFFELLEFPLNENGKIEYSALPAPDLVEYDPPISQYEKEIALIWEEILEIELVGRNHAFLQLGGNSINIMNMIAKIYEKYEVDLTLEVIFENSQLSEIARYVEIKYNEMKLEMAEQEELDDSKSYSGN
ncbi:non-ribosomal peptide synthetase [Paenibacillus polysaccharolyticus]|uniref:non-ribosomal peptide synthetase n=1 Tax=Paenibacillus TaxID=44249 RepID=UPI0012B76B70|nr:MULTISPECIES: non-ribosomal peptide synthetase [Paenibacillus]MCP1132760.1 non-ribosomal peptide synthetase [Paenibacillus polysaccharolyticus]